MLRERSRHEEGAALVMAMLATLVIAALITVMVARAVNETRLTTSHRERETAIHIAEAGIDHVIVGVNADDDHVTGGPSGPHEYTIDPDAALEEQKAWAREVADDPMVCDVVATDGGEACGIRPFQDGDGDGAVDPGEGLGFMFGVGYVPSRAAAEKVRVVKVQFDKGFFSPENAVLTNGDLDFGATICGNSAHVHTNGDVNLRGGADTTSCADPDGNVNSTGSYSGGGSVGPDSGQVDRREQIPEIRAETVYRREAAAQAGKDDPATTGNYEGTWYDLCSNGEVRAPDLDGDGELVLDGDGRPQPCQGPLLSSDPRTYVGWRFRNGAWETTPRVIPDGVYYVHESNVNISGNVLGANSGVVNMTVVVDAVGDIVGQPDTGDCDTRDGQASGNLAVQGVGGGSMNPYLQDMLFLADGDFTNSGNNSTTLHGAILAHEQVELGGTVTYTGAVIAEGACNSTNSPVGLNGSAAYGNFHLTHNGDLALPLDSVTRITAWNEL